MHVHARCKVESGEANQCVCELKHSATSNSQASLSAPSWKGGNPQQWFGVHSGFKRTGDVEQTCSSNFERAGGAEQACGSIFECTDGAEQARSSDFERTGGPEQGLCRVFEAGGHEVS